MAISPDETRTQPKTDTRSSLPHLWRCAGQKCELGTGQPRSTPHRDRRLEAKGPESSVSKGSAENFPAKMKKVESAMPVLFMIP